MPEEEVRKGQAYRITPKGVLWVRFGDKVAEEVWQALVDYGKKMVSVEGGQPAIVLDDEGGSFILVEVEDAKRD